GLRGQRLRAVHAHVEWCGVSPVREAPHGTVELRATDTQVEQDPHDVPLAVAGAAGASHDVGDFLEAAVHDAGPFPEGLECRTRRVHCGGVPVDAEEMEIGPGGEDLPRMPSPADG